MDTWAKPRPPLWLQAPGCRLRGRAVAGRAGAAGRVQATAGSGDCCLSRFDEVAVAVWSGHFYRRPATCAVQLRVQEAALDEGHARAQGCRAGRARSALGRPSSRMCPVATVRSALLWDTMGRRQFLS